MSDVKKLNHEQVMEIIPHRDPMLLIDEATELVPGERIVATFWVDPAREIFKGHFPGDPVLPGVYTVEATAQATDLVLMTKPEYVGKTPLFLGINNVRFRKKILPGDTLEIECAMTKNRGAFYFAEGKGSVNGKVCVQAEFSFALVKPEE